MEVIIDSDLKVDEYLELIKSVGWKELNPSQVKRGLANSMFKFRALVNNKTVGMVRLVGDFGCHGLLVDVSVHPDYQGNGIGSMLVEKIKESVYDFLNPGEQFLVEFTPSAGKREFYTKLGFKYKPENMDGMYLWFKKD